MCAVAPTQASEPKAVHAALPQLRGAADCSTVLTRLPALARRGVPAVGCVGRPQPVAGATSPAAACSAQLGFWLYYRFTACGIFTSFWRAIDTQTGRELAKVTFRVDATIELGATSPQWQADQTFTVTGVSGQAAGLTMDVVDTCAPACAVVGKDQWGVYRPFSALGARLNGGFDVRSNVAVGGQPLRHRETYALKFRHPRFPINLGDGSLAQGFDTRCDGLVNNGRGCVFPGYEPQFEVAMSDARYGESAALIAWAQTNMVDHWGYYGRGKALHRLGDDAAADANRRAVCAGFQHRPPADKPNDSCDEWAFAGSKESGNLIGGLPCAEVTVRKHADGNYYIHYDRYNGTERCVRGHVDSGQNSNVGGALGRFTIAQRLVPNDGYWVGIAA